MNCGWTDSLIDKGRLPRTLLVLLLSLGYAEVSLAQTAQTYRQQATELARAKAWDEAIAAYRKSLELEPRDSLTHYNLALALKYKGDARQAADEFESALRLKPNWADAHYGLGATWYAPPSRSIQQMLVRTISLRAFTRSKITLRGRKANCEGRFAPNPLQSCISSSG